MRDGKWNEHVIYSEPLVKNEVRKKMIHIWMSKTKSMNIKAENDFEVQLIVLLIGILNPMSCFYKNLFGWFRLEIPSFKNCYYTICLQSFIVAAGY